MVENEEAPDPESFTDESPNPEQDINLAVVCDALQERGITKVTVRYQGSGDSGAVEAVEFDPEDIPLPEWIGSRLQDVGEDYCPDGYENNGGGYGTLTIYPFLGLAELEHYDRYEDSEGMDTSPEDLPKELHQRLSGLGVTGITANFDGCGDSGEINDFTVAPDSIEIDSALQEEVEDFLCEQLPGGWEINAGSFGQFSVDMSDGSVDVDAYGRIEMDSDAQTTSWKWRK